MCHLIGRQADPNGDPACVVLIRRGHMRTMVPPWPGAARELYQKQVKTGKRVREFHTTGWEEHLNNVDPTVDLVPNARGHCRRCQAVAKTEEMDRCGQS